MTEQGSGGDPTKLGRWTWVRICGKDGVTTVFVLAYRPCKSVNGLNAVWNQQVLYFRCKENIEVPDIHVLFVRNLCKVLGDMRDDRCHIILEMDGNNDV